MYLHQEQPWRIQAPRRRSAAKHWLWGYMNPTAMVCQSVSPLPTPQIQARTKKPSRCLLMAKQKPKMQRGHPQQTLKGHWKNPTLAQLWRSQDVAWVETLVSNQKACLQLHSAKTQTSWPCDAACGARRSSAVHSSTRPGKQSAFAEGHLCKEVYFGLIRILKLVQKFENLPVYLFLK